ncbi:MAG TPA: cache domain-containing protein [Thermoanaerobaculaceae bacterium]|nr:cache domain-containing protein [Thermoanaerobaculaceae bacterium]HRS14915.1 cache domain-containing protein [Thermoanaerobaculaceae bacterium]
MSVRFQVTIRIIAVIVLANLALSTVGVWYLRRQWREEVQTQVRLDLNSARAAYESRIDRIEQFLRGAALGDSLAAALARRDGTRLDEQAARIFHASGLDLVTVLDAQGRALARGRAPSAGGDDLSPNPLVASALARLEPAQGTLLVGAEELAREGPELAERARFRLRPTQAARPTDETVRTEGMVLAAVVPVLDAQGRLLGLLYGGNLLNRQYDLVDAIRDDVFANRHDKGRSLGTVTVFQRDLRIATNVRLEDGSRAVGTRLSAEVYDEVLVRGRVWASPAFVVNDWYISAYEPIRDPRGEIIGALYVGLLQAPFEKAARRIGTVLLALVGTAALLSLVLVVAATLWVLRPIGHVVAMAGRVAGGDLSARVGIRPPGEMGVLCQSVDLMAEAVEQREEQLKLATSQQISRSEKLASIGRLAAGVAHEINNPLTSVLTFAHLLKEKPNLDDQDRQDLDLIIHETTRVADIVSNLLDFARERPPRKEPLDVNDVVRRTVRLVRSQKQFDRITIEEQLSPELPEVEGDRNQLQQVLLNLALNACAAMPDGGTMRIATSVGQSRVRIEVSDTGCGIPPEVRDMIFDPFFSTKPAGRGTGLGLSVSLGIVQQHGGTLDVESEVGRGSRFTVSLPALPART